jgi:hypothetical protein
MEQAAMTVALTPKDFISVAAGAAVTVIAVVSAMTRSRRGRIRDTKFSLLEHCRV